KSNQNFTDLDDVFGHALPWNGFLELTRISKKSLKNTCTIDLDYEIIELIEEKKYNRAKTIWITKICNLKTVNNSYSTFGTEHEFTLKYLNQFQTIDIALEKDKSNNVIILLGKRECGGCKLFYEEKIEFIETPPFLVIENMFNRKIDIKELPPLFKFNNHLFQLLFATHNLEGSILEKSHFRSIFKLNHEFYLVDDLSPNFYVKIVKDFKISSCFYYLVDEDMEI
ncbi:unnamed protein product, partial [Brachionus calyciflorus]